MKIAIPLDPVAALLAFREKNHERLERLNKLSPGAVMPYVHSNEDTGAPRLWLACARCTDGCRDIRVAGKPTRRERCDVCGGEAILMTHLGQGVAKLIAHVLSPLVNESATDEAIAAFNAAAAAEHAAKVAADEDARKKRAQELRGLADDLAKDPTLMERVRSLLANEASK